MSRSGYSEDYDSDSPYPNALALYRGSVRAAIRGKRGQAFLRELLEALDALPEKKLIAESLQRDGAVCAIGSVGARRGTKMDDLDPEEADQIAKRFGIAECMVREIEFVNDDDFYGAWPPMTDEQRFERVRWVVKQIENPGESIQDTHMGHHARGEVWIPLEDWIEFVRKYMPATEGEWSLGEPRETEGEIVVPFAINTECHPREEAHPPEWIKSKASG